jgi:hypothetical protein
MICSARVFTLLVMRSASMFIESKRTCAEPASPVREVGDELGFATSTEGGFDTWFDIGGMAKGNCS